MKVIILGGGQVGYSIAKYLAFEDNDITLVDKNPELLRRISDKIDVQPILGMASYPETLQRAKASSCDLLIAVTGSDEVNMIACEIANKVFDVPTKIARVRHRGYLKMFEQNNSPFDQMAFHNLPQRKDRKTSQYQSNKTESIDVIISPEIEIAKSLSRSIQISGTSEVISLVHDDLKVVGVRCPEQSPLLNTPLRLLRGLVSKIDMNIICISRGEKAVLPNKEEVLKPGDEVHFICRSKDIEQTVAAFGYQDYENSHQLLIIGAGSIGQTLAQEIEKNQPHIMVKMIEKDQETSERAASILKNTEIICGDALDHEILNEAGAGQFKTVISVTNDDNVNILSSMLAKRFGAKRSLLLLNNSGHLDLVNSLGVDSVLNPRSITVSSILKYVRQGRIRAIHALGDGGVELIEAEAKETSSIIGHTVEDININGTIFIAAIIRGDEIIIAPTKTIIGGGDYLVLVAKKEAAKKIEKLFSIRPSFL